MHPPHAGIAREQAAREKADQAEKELVRQAEREHATRAHERARQRYEAQLSELLAKRKPPKTGDIDELIERLVEADSR